MTYVSQDQALPDYWWKQPAAVRITSFDFDKLWAACKAEMYVRLFPVDREQYREGLLSSESVVSKQAFEPWRTDAVSIHDVAESSLGTIRRTVRFEITLHADGTYEAVPKVLVERWASVERRLTNITQYQAAFSAVREDTTIDQNSNTAPTDYWYPLRRDANLEKDMAASIEKRLRES